MTVRSCGARVRCVRTHLKKEKRKKEKRNGTEENETEVG